MPTELEQAAEDIYFILPTDTNDTISWQKRRRADFKKGAEWQAKQTEDMLNGFFSREAVIEIMNEFMRHYYECLAADEPTFTSPLEWFNANYPPQKQQ